MAEWSETYRGSVAAWECDVTEHFTIAYYFDRLAEATPTIAEALGVALPRDGSPRRLDVRFVRELRAGAGFHIESALLGSAETTLRLGHRIVDSVSGESVTWVQESWDLPAPPGDLGRTAAWPGPAFEPRPEPRHGAALTTTARGRVKPGDLDDNGMFSLTALIHRFTTSSLQILGAMGLDAGYMHRERRALSTFELALHITAPPPRLGEPYLVEAAIVHLGGSSIRYVHRLSDPRDGREIARLSQFGVQLDLDARRPAPFADVLREKAARLTVPTG